MKLLDQHEIDRMADELAEIATRAPLLDGLRHMREASSEEEAISTATTIASVDFLKSQGVEPRPGFRITTRSFEPPDSAPVVNKPDNRPIVDFENGRLTVTCDGWVVSVEQS